MLKNIFVGVDAGATKTRVIVVDDENNILGEALGGPAVIRFNTDAAWQEIMLTLERALATMRPIETRSTETRSTETRSTETRLIASLHDSKYCFHAGMGITGCEIKESYEKFINTPHIFKNLLVKQDSYTACVGAHAGKDGAIVIIGTGVVGIALNDGEVTQVSGWGFPHDDKGSGAWFGLKAVSLTMQWYDGRFTTDSELFQLVLQRFNHDFPKLVTWANNARPTNFAELAPLVIHQAEKNDSVAIEIVKQAARHIDQVGLTLLKKAGGNTKLPCALFGGISNMMKNYLSPEFKASLVQPKYDAAMGAVLALKMQLKNITH